MHVRVDPFCLMRNLSRAFVNRFTILAVSLSHEFLTYCSLRNKLPFFSPSRASRCGADANNIAVRAIWPSTKSPSFIGFYDEFFFSVFTKTITIRAGKRKSGTERTANTQNKRAAAPEDVFALTTTPPPHHNITIKFIIINIYFGGGKRNISREREIFRAKFSFRSAGNSTFSSSSKHRKFPNRYPHYSVRYIFNYIHRIRIRFFFYRTQKTVFIRHNI